MKPVPALVSSADPAPALDTVVIGAGQAGLAAGYHLQQSGRPFVILEAGPTPGGSWGRHYRSLKLFSPARYSSLPGSTFPGDPDHYPDRDATLAYLVGYAAAHRLPVRTGCPVERVERAGDGRFDVHAGGQVFTARHVIAATGSFGRPNVPDLPGQQDFLGRRLHSSAYDTPEPFTGQRVVVVGAANSGVQIATELARVARVTIAARRPPSLVRQRLLGADVHAWWHLFGLDTAPTHTRRAALFKWLHARSGPVVLDPGHQRQALAAGRPDVRPMFERLTPHGVLWSDGQAEPVDAVILATGFTGDFDYLAGLGALDAHGRPKQRHGLSTSVPGLGYVGLAYQRTYASATLRGVGPDAAEVVRRLALRPPTVAAMGKDTLGLAAGLAPTA